MAQRGIQMDQEKLCCSICLDLLKDPVTIPCGHNYCMSCIKSHWDEEDQKEIHSCPQCRQTFGSRPALGRNTMLADLVEELKKTGLQPAPADHRYAGPEDVACDVCTGRKLKALKSCLQCLVSYCEQHLQPHYESPAFGKHKLVEPSKKLPENVCTRHSEVMKMFCHAHQQCICYLCSVTEGQKELGVSRQKIQQRIQNREKEVKLLRQEEEAINHSADEAVEDSEKIFTDLICLIEKRSSDVKQQIRRRQKTKVSRVKELQDKLQQEIADLRQEDTELEQLSHTEGHTQLLHNYPSLSNLTDSKESPGINIRPVRYFKDVTAAVSEVRDKLQDILSDVWIKVSLTETEVDVLLPQAEPKTRDEFLQYSHQITLDPNTAHRGLLLSEGNRKATVRQSVMLSLQVQSSPNGSHSDVDRLEVMSRESLTGQCYWEVQWRGLVSVAVAYKHMKRTGYESGFGNNDKSWALDCLNNGYEFRHNKFRTSVSGPRSSRVGVYLDHSAGVLCFYSVSETMTLLHRVQTTFTQPLYAGLWVNGSYCSVELCEFK
ncbi:tripartite motif-containing protein 16-like [Perca fluviatilis]|uniref:tripartite motif-containing protein 16-like n=1 Tax=Perca fluviatilis TaxID=8168 RepID=UPI0019625BC5|nr:tripartite motif-containing protein 16-like [Perca fluviatilis]